MGTERVIKRYTNRKLYDTDQSRYVTLDDIARLIRENEDVRVVDNETQDDLTAITFAQIILEEEKRKTNLVSVPFLRKLIHSGEAAVQDISDSAKRAIDQIGDLTGRAGRGVREVVEEGGKAIDGALDESRGFLDDLLALPQRRLDDLRDVARKQVDRIRRNPSLQREVERLEKSIHSIEEMLTRLREDEERGGREDVERGGREDVERGGREDVERGGREDVERGGREDEGRGGLDHEDEILSGEPGPNPDHGRYDDDDDETPRASSGGRPRG